MLTPVREATYALRLNGLVCRQGTQLRLHPPQKPQVVGAGTEEGNRQCTTGRQSLLLAATQSGKAELRQKFAGDFCYYNNYVVPLVVPPPRGRRR
jgi:hypothetical protein